jgi:pyruvate dehydrogenase E2 component (dihydrolipoamide acetyltransferase)
MFRIQLARLGQTMEQGTIVQWLKKEGDTLAIGEDLYEVETEKAIVPVQATQPGRLIKIVSTAGSTIPVGAVLAIAADPGEEPRAEEIVRLTQQSAESSPTEAGSGTTEPAAAQAAQATNKAMAVPAARALAKELGVDLSSVKGSGPDGVIVSEDVRRAAALRAPVAAAQQSTRRSPLSPIARSMISAVQRGWQIPQFTQVALVDASDLQRRKSDAGGAISYMDLFLDALVSAAQQVPEAVCSLHGEEVWHHEEINVTIATATDSGLHAPVLRNAGAMNLKARCEAWRALVDKARRGKLAPDDVTGGVIALSNLGTRGVDTGTALLAPGHALIAFFGALKSRALVVDGQVQARPSVHISITYDHRLLDGVMAARFTSAMVAAISGLKDP